MPNIKFSYSNLPPYLLNRPLPFLLSSISLWYTVLFSPSINLNTHTHTLAQAHASNRFQTKFLVACKWNIVTNMRVYAIDGAVLIGCFDVISNGSVQLFWHIYRQQINWIVNTIFHVWKWRKEKNPHNLYSLFRSKIDGRKCQSSDHFPLLILMY